MPTQLAKSMTRGLVMLMASVASAQNLSFSRLPDLPDREGFAGMLAGVSNGALILAGGANFPDKRPWEGGVKNWRNDIWILPASDARWKTAGKLPRALAYGVSATFGEEIIVAGGSNAEGHYADCLAMKLNGDQLSIRALPSLPHACANFCGAVVGSTLFVAGGIEKPDATRALHIFWSLDLRAPEEGWKQLDAWPGKERMLASAGSLNGIFYLFGGAALHPDATGKPEREWLNDAYCYQPGSGWKKLPAMPRVAVAAATPTPVNSSSLFVLSGDDGNKVGFKPETGHPGFPRDALRFDARDGRWLNAGQIPFSRATVPTTLWHDRFVIPNGEARPGYRSNEVWQLDLR